MTMLTIRSLTDPSLTAELVRDVAHTHPAWVHAQLYTDSESDLQSFLDGVQVADYLSAASKICRWADRADAADDLGIYYAGPLYRVTSAFVDGNGVECWNDTSEALGEYAYRLFSDEDEAQSSADDLTDDLEEGSTVSYSVSTIRAAA